MAENVERVRRETLKALEPEIKNLIHKNKLEIGNIESEFETKNARLGKEKEIALQLKVRDYLKIACEKRGHKIDERKDYWEEQQTELRRTNERDLDKTKEHYLNLEEGEKSHRNSMFQSLTEEYDDKVKHMQEKRAQDIEKIQTFFSSSCVWRD